jgi:hypothetical protein
MVFTRDEGDNVMNQITANTSVAEIVKLCPGARRIFDEHGLKGCGGEHGPSEPLAFFATVHQADLDELLREINAEMEDPSTQPYIYKESLQDYIYRRFFKAGVAIVLTVGCLWGAINLLQIALGKSFLQLRLLSSIHAHAHAMIFGWVGMFVMGFAYQSFPRFKNTTLWRPGLANLSFYLLGTGIIVGMAAEMLLPTAISIVFGGLSGAAEITAVVIFMLVLYRTARQSIEPHNPYEKFICQFIPLVLAGNDPGSCVLLCQGDGEFRARPDHAYRADRWSLAGHSVARFRGADHRGGQPALCAARLWSRETRP